MANFYYLNSCILNLLFPFSIQIVDLERRLHNVGTRSLLKERREGIETPSGPGPDSERTVRTTNKIKKSGSGGRETEGHSMAYQALEKLRVHMSVQSNVLSMYRECFFALRDVQSLPLHSLRLALDLDMDRDLDPRMESEKSGRGSVSGAGTGTGVGMRSGGGGGTRSGAGEGRERGSGGGVGYEMDGDGDGETESMSVAMSVSVLKSEKSIQSNSDYMRDDSVSVSDTFEGQNHNAHRSPVRTDNNRNEKELFNDETKCSQLCALLDSKISGIKNCFEGEIRTLEEIITTLRALMRVTKIKNKNKKNKKKLIPEPGPKQWSQEEDFVVRHLNKDNIKILPIPSPYRLITGH